MLKITKAVLTGGGRATRLRPITSTINKHLIELAGQPIIFHAIDRVVDAGTKEIFINTNPGETELQKVIGNGDKWGITITYFEQEGGPQGVGHVPKCAQKFIGDDAFLFYSSDNVILGSLKELVANFAASGADCNLFFAHVPNPEIFGVPVFNDKGELINILEKPVNPPNNFAQTGIYLYGPKVFFEAFDHIQKSARGEYEITDINTYLLKNKKLRWQEISGFWKDTGKVEDLLTANALLLDRMPKKEEYNFANTEIVGPVLIGKNCQIKNCQIGPHVSIGDNCVLENVEISESLIFDKCEIRARTGRLILTQTILGDEAQVFLPGGKEAASLLLGEKSKINL